MNSNPQIAACLAVPKRSVYLPAPTYDHLAIFRRIRDLNVDLAVLNKDLFNVPSDASTTLYEFRNLFPINFYDQINRPFR